MYSKRLFKRKKSSFFAKKMNFSQNRKKSQVAVKSVQNSSFFENAFATET